MNRKLADTFARAAGVQNGASAAMPKKGPARAGKKNKPGLYARLADLYARMQEAYANCASEAGLTCKGCETNCCTSYFQHHTHVEWAYLWRGLSELPEKRRNLFRQRAEQYVEQARQSIAANALPTAMCPLNEDGLCALYAYRLMICRMHGTRNAFTLPNGTRQVFPGCARFTALPCARDENCPTLDRTPFYSELASLELELQKKAGRPLPRVHLTLAEMIVLGPPALR